MHFLNVTLLPSSTQTDAPTCQAPGIAMGPETWGPGSHQKMFPKAQWLRQKLWHQTIPGSVMALPPTGCATWINSTSLSLSLLTSKTE